MTNSRGFRNAVAAGMVVLLAAGSVWAGKPAKPRRDGLLRTVPAKSLFCVRINNLDGSLTAANEFLKGIAPEFFDVKAMALSHLGKDILGNEQLKGVNTKGNFAIFGMNLPGKSAGRGPMGNIFIGALIPVRNYDKFISRSPNCSEPDDEGISTIVVEDETPALVTRLRRFALLCPPQDRDKLVRVKKLMGAKKRGLGKALDENDIKLATTSPVWLYVNVQEGSKLIGPMLFAQLEQVKAALESMKESGQGAIGDPAAIIGFYAGMFKMMIDGTGHVTVGLSPTSDVCFVTVGMKAVPETEMAAMLAAPAGGDLRNLLGYLDDGAMMNLCSKVNRESGKMLYMKLIELLPLMATDGIPKADLEKLKKLMAKTFDAIGDSLAFSFATGGKDSAPFSIKYVIKVRDKKAFEQVIEEELQMMREGALDKLYKGLGMEMDIKVERDIGTHKGVSIDAAKVVFKMGDEDSPQSQMLKKMWGDALDYRWALLDGYCVYSIGGDTDKTIRELIDQVKAGGPKDIGSEMRAALAAIPNSKQADCVGTLNYIRMLNMASGFMVMPGGVKFPQLDVPTKSNIAFAVRTAHGRMTLQMALPKQHLLEIKSAFEKFIPQIQQQEQLQKKQTTNAKAEKAAIESARAWLELVDNERYSESWEEAAEYVKALVNKENWQNGIQGVRQPLGKLVSREVKSTRYTTSAPGAPDGQYVIIQFKTSFENKKSAIETVTPMLDKAGKWRVSGYYIK
jgi:hypothetical protein